MGVDLDGMRVEDKLNTVGGSPVGSFAEWRFDAPAGTTISRLRLWRDIGKDDNAWELYTRTADGTRLGGTSGNSITDSDCFRAPNDFTCQIGFPGGAVADWAGLNTSAVRVGVACSNAQNVCVTGSTLHSVWTAVYSAIVTVDDLTAPTATGSGGSLLTDTYVRGNATATLSSASDVTGIRAVQVKEGGTLLAQTQRTCDYSRQVPCTNLTTPGSVTVATTGMADGQHTIQIGATDAAGNFTAATSQTVTVDNHAPAAPTPTSPTLQTVSSPSATVAWQAPAGQAAAISAAHVSVCGPSSCRTTTQATGPADGSATVSLTNGFGFYNVVVWLEDAAGNVDSNATTSWNVDYPNPNPAPPSSPSNPTPTPGPLPTPPPAPLPIPTRTSAQLLVAKPTVASDRRAIAVKGTVAPGATGTVTVKATAKIHGRPRTVTKRTTIRNRRYAVRLKLASTAWRAATITVAFAGDATHRPARATSRVSQRRR